MDIQNIPPFMIVAKTAASDDIQVSYIYLSSFYDGKPEWSKSLRYAKIYDTVEEMVNQRTSLLQYLKSVGDGTHVCPMPRLHKLELQFSKLASI